MAKADPRTAALLRRAAVHAIAYRGAITKRLQRPVQSYSEALAAWDMPTPPRGRANRAVLDELVRRADPGLHATTGPRFYGWVIGGSHPAGVAADWMTSAWGQNAGNHHAAPAAAAAETVSSRWLLDILGLPAKASVGFVTGATMANFVGLGAARAEVLRRAGWDLEANGLFGAPHVRVLLGRDAHVTVQAALQYLGFGQRQIVVVDTDAEGRMRVDAAKAALGAGKGPCILALQAGQINSGAFDPFRRIIPLARAAGAWVHIDGTFGLWAKAAPARAHLAGGVELADSWATDGHKWLQTPYDCGFAIVRDPEAHRRAVAFGASYLPPVTESERDPTHYVPELSRRARGFAAWAMLRHLGRAGVADLVERNCQLARLIAGGVAKEPGIAVVNKVVLNQVVLRFGGDVPTKIGDELTQRTIARLQQDGTCFAGGSRWRDRWLMRISVSNYSTTAADARRTAAAIRKAWRAVRAEPRAVVSDR